MFNDWLATANKGDINTYWMGHLAHARWEITEALRKDRPADVDLRALEAAGDAWRAYEKGLVTLTQRRVGQNFAYLATKI